MPASIFIPLVILAAALVAAIVVWPSIWLTRSARALAVRRISGPALVAAWICTAIPWAAVLLFIHYRQHFSISVDGVLEVIGAAIVLIVTILVLLSAPLFVLILSIMRFLDRNAIGAT